MVGLVGTQFGLLILLNSVLAKNQVIIYLYQLLWVVLSPWGFIFLNTFTWTLRTLEMAPKMFM